MRLRLYLDEDTARGGLVQAIRANEVDVVSVYEVGKARDPDEQQLGYATQEGRAIYTFNKKDFMRLHTEWLTSGRVHAGIIIGKQQQLGIGEQARRLAKLAVTIQAEEMVNRIEFLSAWGEQPDYKE